MLLLTILDGLKEPYDTEAYAPAFLPVAEELGEQTDALVKSGNTEEARDVYLWVWTLSLPCLTTANEDSLHRRTAALYRIARYPVNRSPKTQKAEERNKAVYLKAAP